jgi:hypothetical protein
MLLIIVGSLAKNRVRDYMYQHIENIEFINWQHLLISEKASQLSSGCLKDEAVAKNCFEFARDKIKHSWDYRLNPMTYKRLRMF